MGITYSAADINSRRFDCLEVPDTTRNPHKADPLRCAFSSCAAAPGTISKGRGHRISDVMIDSKSSRHEFEQPSLAGASYFVSKRDDRSDNADSASRQGQGDLEKWIERAIRHALDNLVAAAGDSSESFTIS